jgi:hypothetical protein
MEIGKINIDFLVHSDILDPTIIVVGDTSEWFSAEDKVAIISITPPGSAKPINNIFAKKQLNIYNASNLGLVCVTECAEQERVDLSDGIWKICLKSAYTGLEKTRYYLKTDRFLVEWYKEWASLGLEYVDSKNDKYDALLDVRKHLTTAESFTLSGDFTKASREFTEAQKKFNKVRKCKDCL